MPSIVDATRSNIARSWRRSLLYGVALAAVSVLLLAPFFVWIQDRALALGGTPVATNVDIARVAASLPGLLALVVWCLGTALLLLLGRGGQVLLSADAVHGVPRPPRAALHASLTAAPRLLRPALLFVGLYGIVLVPLLALALDTLRAAAVGSDENLILQVMPDSTLGAIGFLGALLAVAALCYRLLVRWTFLLHALLLEGLGLRASMRRSAALVATAPGLVLRHVLGLHAGILAALFVGALLVRVLAWLCFDVMAPTPGALFVVLAALLLVLSAVASAVWTAWVGVLSSSLGTALFVHLGGTVPRPPATRRATGSPLPRTARGVVLLGGVLLCAGLLLVWPRLAEVLSQTYDEVQITAHRGSSAEAPENTMAALRLAMEQGAEFSEIDVLQAKDGALVVIHDANLLRLAGRDVNVYDLTGAELRTIDVGAWKGARYKGERIPLLRDVIALVQGRMRLNIELKEHGREQGFPASVVALLHELAFAESCVISSLSVPMLKVVRARDPSIRIGAIVTASIGDVHALDVDFYSVERAGATAPFIRRAHALGRDVHVWTTNAEATMRLMIDRGADSLITDYPARALALRGARGADDELRAILVRLFDR